MKHTPGPWFVGAQNDALYIIDRRPAHSNDYPDHGANVACIARVYDDVRCNEDAGRDNARLIAAAPELLEALDEIANESLYCMLTHDARSEFVELQVSRQALAKARAAIAKATGKA